MYVQTKKVVIIYIVSVITFVSIISTLYHEAQDTIPQISVISSEELSYKNSFAQSAYNEFSVVGDENSNLAMYGANIYQISQKSSAQMTNIVNGSDTIVIVGDTFNEYLSQLINDNDTKQFVLIENSKIFDNKNVYQINLNYSNIYDRINRMSKDQKSVVFVSNKFSTLAENQYIDHEIAANGNVKFEIIDGTIDQAGIKTILNDDLDSGFTNVYSIDPYDTLTIMETITSYNEHINSIQSESTMSELTSDENQTNVSEVETDSSELPMEANLRYLSLTEEDFESVEVNSNIAKYGYDVSTNMDDVTNATVDNKLLSKNELISITTIN